MPNPSPSPAPAAEAEEEDTPVNVAEGYDEPSGEPNVSDISGERLANPLLLLLRHCVRHSIICLLSYASYLRYPTLYPR
jgi:hypothetical protein